jgi:aryl-alcohol dehydrogenase-like predicted oxidoreductase
MRTQSLYRGDRDFDIAERVIEVAEKAGHSPAQIAVAWLLSKPEIIAPVVGVSKVEQLDQLVAAAEIELDESTIAYLEELYQPVENLLSSGGS